MSTLQSELNLAKKKENDLKENAENQLLTSQANANEKIAALESRLSQLDSERQQLASQLEASKVEQTHAKVEMLKLQKESESNDSRMSTVKEQYESIQKDLENKLAAQSVQTEELSAQNASMLQNLNSVKDETNNLKAQMNILSEEGAKLSVAKDQLESQKVELTEKLLSQESHMNQTAKEKQKVEAEFTAMKQEVENSQSELIKLREERQKFESKMTAVKEDHKNLIQETEEKLATHVAKFDKLSTEKAHLSESYNSAKAEVDLLRAGIQTLQDQNQNLTISKDQFESQHAELTKQLASSEKKLREIEAERDCLNAHFKASRADVEKIQAKFVELQEKCQANESSMASAQQSHINKVSELEEKIASQTILVEQLTSENARLSESHNSAKAEADQLRAGILTLQDQNQNLSISKDQFESQHVELTKQLASSERNSRSLEVERDCLNTHYEASRAEVESLKQKLVKLQEEYQAYESRMGVAKHNHDKNIAELEEKITSQTSQIKLMESEKQALTETLNSKKLDIEQLQTRSQSLQEESEKFANLNNQFESQQLLLSEKLSGQANLISQYESEKQTLTAQLQNAKLEEEQMQCDLARLQQESESFESRMSAVKQEYEESIKQLEEKKAEQDVQVSKITSDHATLLDQFNIANADLEKTKTDLQAAQEEAGSLHSAKEQLQEEHNKLSDQVVNYETQVGQHESTRQSLIDQLQMSKNESDLLTIEMAQLKQSALENNSKVEAVLQDKEAALIKLNQTIAAQEASLANLNSENKSLLEQVQVKDQEAETLKKELESLASTKALNDEEHSSQAKSFQSRLAQLESEKEDLIADHQASTLEAEELHIQLQAYKSEALIAEDKIGALKDQYESNQHELKNKVASLESKLELLSSSNTSLVSEIEAKNAQIEESNLKLEVLQDREDEVASLQDQYDHEQEQILVKINDYEAKLSELQAKNESNLKQIDANQDELEKEKSKMLELKEDLANAKDQVIFLDSFLFDLSWA